MIFGTLGSVPEPHFFDAMRKVGFRPILSVNIPQTKPPTREPVCQIVHACIDYWPVWSYEVTFNNL